MAQQEFLYKYRAVDRNKYDCLEEDWAIKALLGNYLVFSSRKLFNDPLDTKIDLIRPSVKELKSMRDEFGKTKKDARLYVDQFFYRGKLTPFGAGELDKMDRRFNDILDSIPILCMSRNPINILMWSHYADSHTGFCLEFHGLNSGFDVRYLSKRAELKIIDCLRVTNGFMDKEVFTDVLVKSLAVKLEDWCYEQEYRFLLTAMPEYQGFKFEYFDNRKNISYDPELLKSVIFGLKTPMRIKIFIRERLPAHVKFKQVRECKGTLEIADL